MLGVILQVDDWMSYTPEMVTGHGYYRSPGLCVTPNLELVDDGSYTLLG
jgi:hypothetical protein